MRVLSAEVPVAVVCAKIEIDASTVSIRNEKINHKAREHSLAKVPVMLVCGKKEGEGRTVSIRRLGSQASTTMGLEEALRLLGAEATAPDLVRAQVGEGEGRLAAE